MRSARKLIEVALPLEAINKEAAREKSIRHGHPSTLHLWWARRPLAACRAVLFASLVDDPSSHPDQFPTQAAEEKERLRLFAIIEELVKWENSNNGDVLGRARAEILRSTGGSPPPVLDPFCGGGSIPLEAQRLGLKAYASDLNPVAVLITKALIEIPPMHANQSPVHPSEGGRLFQRPWTGSQGLAEDVRFYGRWLSDEAQKRIGGRYPRIRIPESKGGGEANVIAWLWARTHRCPNPACGGRAPLLRSLWLSRRRGQSAWLIPHRSTTDVHAIEFDVREGEGQPGEGTVGRQGARCALCETRTPLATIREEGRAARLGRQLVAIVAEGPKGRVFLPADSAHAAAAELPVPAWVPDTALPKQALGFRVQQYGLMTHSALFTTRQLTAMWTFVSLLDEVRELIRQHAAAAGHEVVMARAYADRVCTYLALGISKAADLSSSLCHWQSNAEHLKIAPTFTRHALSMTWDFAEGNPFSESSGNYSRQFDLIAEVLDALPVSGMATVLQRDAAASLAATDGVLVSTDPPYYDNVPYADLSDFFYVWLRKAIGASFPDLMSTVLVPKAQELVAEPSRHGGPNGARMFFEAGLAQAFERIRSAHDPRFPLTIYYAFKQTEEDDDQEREAERPGRASTGWETMLESLLATGFRVEGTWPMRTERPGRLRETGSNALASSIVLVCRNREDTASLATRKEFLSALKRELPQALKHLQQGNIAPVDLAQAAIGPGMAVFSRYSKVVEADGSRMPVRTALGLINQILDDVLAEQESEFDADTRWALAWFEQHRMNEGPYGDAETLATAKDISIAALVRSGLLEAKRGRVRLLRRDELPADWNPMTDSRLTVWELTQHLIRRLEAGGESAAAELLKQVGSLGDVARDLAYRLYNLCERKGWAQEAIAYNGLVTAWPELTRLAQQLQRPEQGRMFS